MSDQIVLKNIVGLVNPTYKNEKFNGYLLFSAITMNKPKFLAHLILQDADINVKNSKGFTPLHEAIFRERIDLAITLIDNGADLNAKTNEGITPLEMSMEYGSPELSELIIERRLVLQNF